MKAGIFSFFSGAGFLDLGFEKTNGYEILFVNEYHKPFMDAYRHSRRKMKIDEPLFGYDLSSIVDFSAGIKKYMLNDYLIEARKKYDSVGFIGGPPCPDFSVAGKNKGSEGDNGRLSEIYFDLIQENKPDFFLFENVKGLYRTKKHRDFFETQKLKLKESGYILTEKLINAIEYGAPQDRERIILIGFHENRHDNLHVDVNGDLIGFNWNSRILKKSSDIFSLSWPKIDSFIENSNLKKPANIQDELTVQFWFDKNNVGNHPNSVHFFTPRAGLSKFKSIPEGDDLKKSYKRLHRWRYSPTAAYGNNEVHLHPYKARRITVAEALSIQSLPKEFEIPDTISLSNMFKTVGNGVPFLAARGLADSILNFLINQKTINAKIISK